MEHVYDLIIIGSGPAGLSAAIYAQRARLDTLILEASYVSGGQVVNTYEVDNYPGLPGISGMELGSTLPMRTGWKAGSPGKRCWNWSWREKSKQSEPGRISIRPGR